MPCFWREETLYVEKWLIYFFVNLRKHHVEKAVEEDWASRVMTMVGRHWRQIVCPRLWKSCLIKTCFNIRAPTGMEIAMSTISERIWRKCQCYISGIIHFFKNEHSFYWLLLFGEMFSVFLNCAFLSCLDFSCLYEGQWHKNREMDLTQISLNCLRSARSFSVRDKIASAERHTTGDWMGWTWRSLPVVRLYDSMSTATTSEGDIS